MDRQQLAEQQTQDVKILQKVNRIHREAFAVKFPSQTEHCLRLTMERLQAGLDKRDGVDVADPDTWRMSTDELRDLAQVAEILYAIRQSQS
jgi:hypothetical protein